MKITHKPNTKLVKFNDIPVGECFQYGENRYVKIHPPINETETRYRCLCLDTFRLYTISDDTEVQLLNSELILGQ